MPDNEVEIFGPSVYYRDWPIELDGDAVVEVRSYSASYDDKPPPTAADQVSEILAKYPISMKGNRRITKQYRKRAGATPDERR